MANKLRKSATQRIFKPDVWPVWRRAAGQILWDEGPMPVSQLVRRIAHLVPPDRALHERLKDRETHGVKTTRVDDDTAARSGQYRIVYGTLHSAIQTGFFRRWYSADDVTMIELGEAGRRYYEERDAQGANQSAQVQRDGEGSTGTN